MRQLTAKPLPGWAVVGSSLVLVPAVIVVFVAAADAAVFCIDGCSDRQANVAVAQLVVAAFGLLVVVGMLLAAVRGWRRWAAAMLTLAVATYATWGVLIAA